MSRRRKGKLWRCSCVPRCVGRQWGPQRQRPQPRYEPLLNAEDPRLQMLAQDELYETRQWDDKVQPEGEHGPKSFPLPQTAVQLCHRNAVCLAAESALRISSATEMVRRGSVQTKSTGAWMWTFSPLGESLRRSSWVGCCLVWFWKCAEVLHKEVERNCYCN